MESEIPQTAASDETCTPTLTVEAPKAEHKQHTGLRVLRTSPAVLLSCGLVFVSLILLLNFMTQTGKSSARQSAATASTPSPETQKQSRTATASAPENPSHAGATTPQPQPSVETVTVTAAAPKPEVVEPVKASPPPAPAPPANSAAQASSADAHGSEDGFTLQISSYNEPGQAQERVDELGSFGVRAYVARVEIPRRGTWYRVQAGHFSSREEATRYGAQLRSKGAVADFIVTTSKVE